MRAIKIPAYNSYLGHHYLTMGVLPDNLMNITEYYINDFYENIGDFITDLSYTPCNYYQVFDLLRSNRISEFYDSAFILHEFDARIPELEIQPDTVLANSVEIFGHNLSSNYSVSYSIGRDCVIQMPSTYGLTQSVVLNRSSNEGFIITCGCIFESQLNGNKFNFSTTETNAAGRIQISATRAIHDGIVGYNCSVLAGYAGGLISSDLVSILNGHDADDSDTPDNDPYSGGDTGGGSNPGGGNKDPHGSNNYTSDSESNPIPGLPALSAVDTGLITLYAPGISQLRNLATYLWGASFDIEQLKKMFADPMNALLGLAIVPVTVPLSSSSSVVIGNIDTGISMGKASSQYVELNCGSINLKEYWKGYMDYSPYTKISIFLPYIGFKELETDLIQNTALGLVYHVDILTGGCVAFITAGGNVIAQFAGECSVNIPITSQNFTQTIMAISQIAAGGIGVMMTGGMSAPITGEMVAKGATAMANTAANMVSSKPRISKSGSISGSGGLLGSQVPFIIIEKPRQCAPKRQNQYMGYPSYITKVLGNESGFTQVQDIRLNGIPCTETEREELMKILREGIII